MYFWDNVNNNRVIDNIFIDNDCVIGFGMRFFNWGVRYVYKNGVVKNNIIYYIDNGDFFGDVGIMVEGNFSISIDSNIIF